LSGGVVVVLAGCGVIGKLQAESRRRINNKEDMIWLNRGRFADGIVDVTPLLESL
jgi:hypothetical protein